MEKLNNKIIYPPNGQPLRFFYLEGKGICQNSGDGDRLLLSDCHSNFDVCAIGNEIYLVCQNANGDLLFLRHFDAQWRKYTLLMSKNKLAYDKHIRLAVTGSCAQLFYTVRSGERTLLAGQILSEITSPFVIAPVSDCIQPFDVVSDDELNTHIYFCSENSSLTYRLYKWSSKSMGEPINAASVPCSFVHACADFVGCHHICSVSGGKIMYMKRNANGSFTSPLEIAAVQANSISPYIHIGTSDIYVVWCDFGLVMYAKSNDGGKSFSSPVKLMSSGAVPVLFTKQFSGRRALSLGCFVGEEIRFFFPDTQTSTPLRTQSATRPHTSASPSANELTRLKRAISALGTEMSEVKNRIELLESFVKGEVQKNIEKY